MSAHNCLLSLSLLVSLAGAGHAMEPPFSAGFDSGPQIALRLISDKTSQEQAPADDAEQEEAPSTQASGTPPPRADLPEDLDLSDPKGEDRELAGQGEAGEDEAPGLEGEFERNPELAGQGSLEEEREKSLAHAEAVLNRVDQILLDARAQARQEREGRSDGDGTAGSAQNEDLPAWETQGDAEEEAEEEEGGRGGVAEGQVPGNIPTGKTRPSHGYDREEDIVTRQVCELAEREEDPEVRKHLEEKCESLRKG